MMNKNNSKKDDGYKEHSSQVRESFRDDPDNDPELWKTWEALDRPWDPLEPFE